MFLKSLRIDETQLDDTGLAYVRDYRFDVLLALIDYVLSPYNAAKPAEPDRVVKRLLDIKILFEQGKITNEERQKIYKKHNLK